ASRRTGIDALATLAAPAVVPAVVSAAASTVVSAAWPTPATDRAAARSAAEAITASTQRRMEPPVPPIGTSTQYSHRAVRDAIHPFAGGAIGRVRARRAASRRSAPAP